MHFIYDWLDICIVLFMWLIGVVLMIACLAGPLILASMSPWFLLGYLVTVPIVALEFVIFERVMG